MTPRPSHLLLLLAPLVACVKGNNASVEIFTTCFPPEAATCSFSSKCDKSTMSNQIIDLSLTGSLFLPVEVHNQMADNADASGHVNTNDARVQQVSVSYDVPGFSVGSITNDLQQTVPANGSTVLGLELLNNASATAFAVGLGGSGFVDAIMNVKLKGVLVDGSKFETGTYRVPVTVCFGCLVGTYTCDTAGQVATKFCIQEGQKPATWTCGAPATTYTLGGSVTGLTATGLAVTCNGTSFPIAASSTSWTSTAGLPTGSAYVCTIGTQPTGQTCSIANGTGSVSGANVTNINITCA